MSILRKLVGGRTVVVLLIVITVLVATASVAEACPQCKQALASSEGGTQGNIVRGYFWSILFMLSMPFVVFGSFCTYMYLEVRKARRKLAAAQATAIEQATSRVVDDTTDRFTQRAESSQARERETVEV